MIKLKTKHSVQIENQVHENSPEIICGAITGYIDNSDIVITEILKLENERAESRDKYFLITPENYLAAENAAVKIGNSLLGFYYSVNSGSPSPSGKETEYSLPGLIYLRAEINSNGSLNFRGWTLNENRKTISVIDTEITDEKVYIENQEYALAV